MTDKFTSPTELAKLNIEHFNRLLQTPLDGQKRATIEVLLAQEKAKLKTIPKEADPKRHSRDL
jgi:hypothetical protein